jgi:glutamate--cysteine ligase
MISGIHYNYSLSEETIQKLYDNFPQEISYKNFKNMLYLKIVRNYIRYKWLIIYLTGTTPSANKTFTEECLEFMDHRDLDGDYYSNEGSSIRNSRFGYKNLVQLYPRYENVKEFTEDISDYIEK